MDPSFHARSVSATLGAPASLFPFRGVSRQQQQQQLEQHPHQHPSQLIVIPSQPASLGSVCLESWGQDVAAGPSQVVHRDTIADRRLLLHVRFTDPITCPKPDQQQPTDIRQAAVDRLFQYLDLPGLRRESCISSSGCTSSNSTNSTQVTPKGDAASAVALSRASFHHQLLHYHSQQQHGLQHISPLLVPAAVEQQQLRALGGGGYYRPQPPGMYDTATACEHSDYHKCLRVKKGFIYYVCYLCGAKWRDPAHRRHQRALQRHLQEVVVPPQ